MLSLLKNKKDKLIRSKYKILCQEIEKYQQAYYDQGISLISDAEYDQKYHELQLMEEKYSDILDCSNSPLQRVGWTPHNHNNIVQHAYPMLSLNNAWHLQDLIIFEKRIQKTGADDLTFISEPKIDGIAVSISYRNGTLTRGLTRGDGINGENITMNLQEIPTIPHTINWANSIEVRGELVIHKDDFKKLLAQSFSNERNAVSGIVRRKNIIKQYLQLIKFYAYELVNSHLSSDTDSMIFLEQLGFTIVPEISTNTNGEDCIRYHNYIINTVDLPFRCDGSVHKVNTLALRQQLGSTIRHPKWAIAFKTSSQEHPSKINSIDFQIGRSGELTPVANITPTVVDGVTVKRVTLHNISEMQRMQIGINQPIMIKRAGQVIPIISRVLDRYTQKVILPTHCLSCQSPLRDYICINSWKCKAQILHKMRHFISKEAFNVQGCGNSTLKHLIDQEIISKPYDLFTLTTDILITLPLFGEKKAHKIRTEIEKRRTIKINRLIFALSIPRVGKRAALLLGQRYPRLEDIQQAPQKELIKLIGEKTTQCVIQFFSQEQWIKELLKHVRVVPS